MQIFYNCSFKSSDGFKMVNYDYETDTVACIEEKSSREKFSPIMLSTLRYGLGRSMMLATDEKGCYFFGIYNLVIGNYDKYVNAVFWDLDKEKILKLFIFFCYRYADAKNMLQSTIERIPLDQNGLEYCVRKCEVETLVKLSADIETKLAPGSDKKCLLAFVTEENSRDYLGKIEECCNLSVKNVFVADNISHEQVSVDISGFLHKKNVSVAVYVIIIIVVIILFFY